MSMSTHVIGIKPPDDDYRKYKNIYDACVRANVQIPEEVDKFFDYQEPDDEGVLVEIEENGAAYEYNDNSSSGYEVDLSLLPKDVKVIRFYNSW